MRIQWNLIAKAIAFYESAGFTYVEVPWIVKREAVDVTLPPGHKPFTTLDGTLVGSAEQSFIELMLDGRLSPGLYVAASPCFRDDLPDHLHQRAFFKVEVIDLRKVNEYHPPNARHLADLALNFFESLPWAENAKVVATPDGYDIQLNGIELGSYGVRTHDSWQWIYGTGIAEPRFSIATGS